MPDHLVSRMKSNSKFTAAINKNVPKPIGSCEASVAIFMSPVFIHNYISNSNSF